MPQIQISLNPAKMSSLNTRLFNLNKFKNFTVDVFFDN